MRSFSVVCDRRRLLIRRRRCSAAKSAFLLRVLRLDKVFEVCYSPRAGFRPFRVVPRNGSGLVFADWSREEYQSLKKRVLGGSGVAGSKHLAPLESVVFSKLFKLVEHCAIRQYDDSTERQAGWFTVKTVGSAWVIQVKDPDSCASLTATASTLDDALALADLLLATDDAPWESDPWLKRKKPGTK